jgi:hypothetical protein
MSGFISLAAVVIVAVLIFLVLFEPTVAYRARRPAARIDSREFVNYLGAIVNAPPVLTNQQVVCAPRCCAGRRRRPGA